MKKILLSVFMILGATGLSAQTLAPELQSINTFLNHMHGMCLQRNTTDSIGLSEKCKQLHHDMRKVVTITPIELLYFASLLEVMANDSKPKAERDQASKAMLDFVYAKGQ